MTAASSAVESDKKRPNKRMKILIVKLSSIGDVVHTLPSLYALKKGFDKKGVPSEIDWLVEESASSILRGNPLINNLIVVKNRGWTRDSKVNIRTVRFLASRRYDMVLDFQGLFKSAVWVGLSKAGRRIGFSNSRELSYLFLNERVAAYDPDKHAVDRYLDLARYAGGEASGVEFLLNIGKEDIRSVKTILEKNGIETATGSFCIMVPTARWSTKLWEKKKFIELGKKLYSRRSLRVLITGSGGERGKVERIRAGIGEGAYNVAGLFDLKGLAALMKLAGFAVTVDSGPMHIAAAAGLPVIALFGPTSAHRTGPYGEGHIVVSSGLGCSPCFRKTCPDPRCMKEITVEDVLDAVFRLLG